MSSPPQRPSVTADPPSGSGPGPAIGADRALMLEHLPERHRPAFAALWALDAAMGDVVARSTQPALGRVTLAWWRDALEQLDDGTRPPEPRLRAIADQLLPRGISGADLAALEPGWATLLDEQVDPALVARRGSRLFAIGGRILGAADDILAEAGALHALVAVGRRGVPELLEAAEAYRDGLRGHRFARPLRVLTGLARIAARDLESRDVLEPEGTPARALAMLRHRWSGKVTRRR